MRFFSDSLRGGTGTWTFSWNRNKNKQRYRQFVFKTSIVTQGKITTVKYFNKKNLPQPLLEYDQPSVEWGSPAAWAHRQGFDYSSHRNYCDVVITVLVVVVNVLNTGIFFMSRSDGKWRERSAEVASARSTRASTSSPRSRLTNPFLKYKHPHWNYHHQEHTLIPQFLYKMLKKSIFILTEEGEWKKCFLPRKSFKTSSRPRWEAFWIKIFRHIDALESTKQG